MEWIIPMSLGLILDMIGAVFIAKSIFSIKFVQGTLTIPDNLPEKESEMLNGLEKMSSVDLTSKNDSLAVFRSQLKGILDDTIRHRKNKKYAKIGLTLLIIGFNLQIIANFIILAQASF